MTKRTGRRGTIITRRGGLLAAEVVPVPKYPGEAEARAGSGLEFRETRRHSASPPTDAIDCLRTRRW
jgi:hypothetical protein